MLVKGSIIQFERLQKTMEKTEAEHSAFLKTMVEAMAKADFPTVEMVDDLEKELR